MGQIKVFGLKDTLAPIKETLSSAIHAAVVEAFQYPQEKKFHRFFPMEKEDFYFGSDRTENYIIIEISVFEGRSVEAKKKLIHLLYEKIGHACGISAQDVEITIFETPKHNWGIRGIPGDELILSYQVGV